jgi:SAM-dependent methyltransferase
MAWEHDRYEPAPLGLDRPATARVYDHLLAGKDAYAPDRQLAETLSLELQGAPAHLQPPVVARANRAFLERVVRSVAGHGVRQWLDVGAGMPHSPTVHELVHERVPGARVVYLDKDPIVLSHAQALPGTGGGLVVAAQADLARPRELLNLPAVRDMLTSGEPVALLLVAVLHFLPAAEQVMQVLRPALPPGSHLVISHAEFRPELAAATEVFRTGVPGQAPGIPDYTPRTTQQIRDLFGDLPLVDPGLVPVNHWRPDLHCADSDSHGKGVPLLGAVARTP